MQSSMRLQESGTARPGGSHDSRREFSPSPRDRGATPHLKPANDNGGVAADAIDPRILIVARAIGRQIAREQLDTLPAANDNRPAISGDIGRIVSKMTQVHYHVPTAGLEKPGPASHFIAATPPINSGRRRSRTRRGALVNGIELAVFAA